MKKNIWTIVFSVLGGAFICFFALIYWNLFAAANQIDKADTALEARISAVENFLNGNNKAQ